MSAKDLATILHPAIAAFYVFPLIGIAVYYAWQTRQRRLQAQADGKSKIPPVVGSEHLKLGKWLSASVVGIALLGMAQPIVKKLIFDSQNWAANSTRFFLILLFFVATIASLVMLYRARTPLWRAVFATLCGMGVIIIGFQKFQAGDGNLYPLVFRRDYEWYVSHFYFGMGATMLMIFSLATIPDIYKDRSNGWRKAHALLNCVALLFFIFQGITGARDLIEIPPSWQQPYVEQLYINNCQAQPCQVTPAAPSPAP
ncbi:MULTISPECIES: DUF4079 domain-containing protein [unclassified Leptolyngbya]|uniref:DUF4079 domain-containing protein n=1 Tax=unclassified Leptolyngbya TaxID=2650499 RepID=UPI001685351D|nr:MULTISPECIES: DUF4079 domain-containing protein [unclassified Leptolyngbya]MBD1912284.1 DUF4079 domain-containing protein [Leptolyngbya sp. FACHB-8]MBD2153853.1 DUF4079 domain-containing protein [Leptolyngbya sp. FACHB-16]